MVNFNRFKTFIFDLDGTIWDWARLFPGVKETIKKLKANGKQVIFVTNNSLLSRRGLIKKLRNFGIDVRGSELVSSSLVVAEYLKKRRANAFAIGKGIRDELKRAGIMITDKVPDYLVVGQDLKFDSKKLLKAYKILEKGAKLLSAAGGRTYYIGEKLYPATGVLVNAIEFISNKKTKLLGKPSDEMLETIQLFVSSSRKETVLFGDECDSDILTGKKLGYYTVLVRTGIDEKASKRVKPNLVLDSVANIKIC